VLGQWRPATSRYGRRSAAVALQALLTHLGSPARRRESSSALTVIVALYIARVHRGVVFLFWFAIATA
jgi:hypothetical protein